jgi:hypothetical protein
MFNANQNEKAEKSHIINNLKESDYRSTGKRRTKQEEVHIEIIYIY